jgi:hypothetical protein
MRLLAPSLVLLIVSSDLWASATRARLREAAIRPAAGRLPRAAAPLTIDGRLDEPPWRRTAWSEPFVDIEGGRRPPLSIRVRMLWDDAHFYAADVADAMPTRKITG